MGLNQFLSAIDLLNSLTTNDLLKNLLVTFIKTKLSGQAGEFITDELATVDQIKDRLKVNIKPNNSKVVEGRLVALKMDRMNLQDFSKQAEDLANQFKCSLIMECIPHAKANKMTVEQTVKMCRASAKSEFVRSIIASIKFETAKEVISKLIIETNQSKEEDQILSVRGTQKRYQYNNSRYFSNNQFRQNNTNRNYRSNGYSHNNNSKYNPNYIQRSNNSRGN